MKKLALFAFAAIFALTATFAESEKKVVHAIHLAVPIQFETWESTKSIIASHVSEKPNNDITFCGANFAWNKMSANESGFSFLIGMGLGATVASSGDLKSLDGQKGFESDLKLGWGFAPIRSENNILAFHGFINLDFKYLDNDKTKTMKEQSIELNYITECFEFKLGIDAVFVHHFSEHFGLFTGLDVSTTVLGYSAVFVSSDNKSIIDNESYSFDISGKINIIPRIGICWII